MSALRVEFCHGGVVLPELGLWLDPRRPQPAPARVFVSHAHTDHTARHQEVILTPATARLMRARMGGKRVEHALSFGETREFACVSGAGRFRITLLPAGHVWGSAMAWVDAGGESLLFTGDFKLERGLLAEPCQPRAADVLIMETTFGRPEYRFPAADRVLCDIIDFCRTTASAGAMPVLMAYSLGKSQSLLDGLARAGLEIHLHRETHRLTRVHQELGCTFPAFGLWDGKADAGRLLVCPPGLAALAKLRAEGVVRTAAVTGWALDRGYRFRAGCDAAFPLSDHVDFDELIRLVERVRPRRVITVHGFAREFAWTLRDMGWRAEAGGVSEQLTLPFLTRRAPAVPP